MPRAANHPSSEITDAHPETAWPQIHGFRNILVHQYFGIDVDIICGVIETRLPPLAEAPRRHVAEGDPRP
ncbi:MAG: DUF86 domain-containing protein [Bifidobacteriaceae bacterium]|nr:DUF86 domain-containing protein [Bifidobacteriaceae bacterium]